MDTTKRRFLIGGSTAVLAAALSGCGTLLYPERKGQSGGRIDPSVAILDGIGLLLFLIPGLVAFAVDFSNGTIYLPGTKHSSNLDEMSEVKMTAALTKSEVDRVWAENYGHAAPFELSDLERRRLGDKAVTLDTVASLARNDFARI
tara:strand:- start:2991 stop:3428 length:438 start_codon:yes stop_codon:yes gene_type:complete